MVHMFEKVNKTSDNEFGIKEIRDENPFLNGPCIITILAVPYSVKDINGSLRQVADLVNPEIDDNYDSDRRIIGLGFGTYNDRFDKFSSFSPSEFELVVYLSKFIFPLFIRNDDEKIDVYEAMNNFRNLTFLTYCNGAKTFRMIEDVIVNTMKEVGYTETEIRMIMSQICLASIGTNYLKNYPTNVLAFSFGDVNDKEYMHDEDVNSNIKINNYGFIGYDSSLGYGIYGSGNHDFKRYMTGDSVISSYIKRFLNTSIDNALLNRDNQEFVPITYEKMANSFNDLNINLDNNVGGRTA